ncbi:MAG: hypothetical protein R3C30_14790 [Hyphomonadaceae bacterium]
MVAWVYTDLATMLGPCNGGVLWLRGSLRHRRRAALQRCPAASVSTCEEVNLKPEGDARLDLDLSDWREVSREAVAAGPNDDADFVVRTLERA